MDAPSRYEVNRTVRNMLVRAGADMGQLSHTAADQSVHIYGTLVHDDGSAFTNAQVERLMESILRRSGRRGLTADITNWDIQTEYGSVVARPRKDTEGKYASARPRHFEIDEQDMLRDLLDE